MQGKNPNQSGGYTRVDTQAPQFVDGRTWGWSSSVKIHATANLVGDIELGEGCRIDGQVTITGRVTLGRNVHIATGARIFGGAGVVLGDHTGLGPGSTILTATDDPDSDLIGLHSESELERVVFEAPVTIGRYVLIGAHCVILPGAIIRDEVILGALSMARGTLLAGRIYAGVPAREIRNRPKLRYEAAPAVVVRKVAA